MTPRGEVLRPPGRDTGSLRFAHQDVVDPTDPDAGVAIRRLLDERVWPWLQRVQIRAGFDALVARDPLSATQPNPDVAENRRRFRDLLDA